MKRKIEVVSYLIILLFIFTISCGDPEWVEEHRITDADGCVTVRYKKVLWDRVEYKEEVTCPNGMTITETWTE